MSAKIGEYFFAGDTAGSTDSASLLRLAEQEYTTIINLYIPYFKELPDELKKKFIQRTVHFRSLKEFHYVGMAEQKEIPILISAAAVQLTLGFDRYELPFFKNIFVTPDAYRAKGEQEIFVGHTSPEGVYISWKYFLHGYSNGADNVNVAIHEMAHALQYELFAEEINVDADLKSDFNQFLKVSGPIFAQAIVNRNSYLRQYAFTNMQEFWAVSVETFFENPTLLKQHLPALYNSLCAVLNQDPLSLNKILK